MAQSFYYVKHSQKLLYYTYNSFKKRHEFYVNENLIQFHEGPLHAELSLSYEDYKLKVDLDFFGENKSLYFKNRKIPLKKVSKKEFLDLLTIRKIHNELNPTTEKKREVKQKRQEDNNRLKERLYIPIILIIIGFTAQYFLRNTPKLNFIAIIPEAFAGWYIYKIIAERNESIKNNRKAPFAFIGAVVVGLYYLGEFLFKYF